MPANRLARFTLLPELRLEKVLKAKKHAVFEATKISKFEVCPKCASKSHAVYDRRIVIIRDQPIHGRHVQLHIKKRRFMCKPCKKPFTEPVSGISKGHRTSARYRRHLLWACNNFSDLKKVRKHMGCSFGLVYKALYEQLDLKRRERLYPWPKTIGIDEHSFKKAPKGGWPIFTTMIVDHKNKRLFDMVEGRSNDELFDGLHKIPGRDNVKLVTMDLSTPYRKFVKEFFPQANIVADKFHVVRLLHPAINKMRKEIAGDRRKNPIGRLLLSNSKKLDFYKRSAIFKWLEQHPELKELYLAKEAIHGFYRIKGLNRARNALKKMLDRFGHSKLKAIKTLRKTLLNWRHEILRYFRDRITNARVEGFNNKAKVVKRKAYGYRSFTNYRLRVLNACS